MSTPQTTPEGAPEQEPRAVRDLYDTRSRAELAAQRERDHQQQPTGEGT